MSLDPITYELVQEVPSELSIAIYRRDRLKLQSLVGKYASRIDDL